MIVDDNAEMRALLSAYFRRLGFISMRALMTMAYLANARVAAHMRMAADTDPFHIGDRVLEQPPPRTSNRSLAA